jgi:hypothetical protein
MSNEALVKQLRKLAPICRGQAEIYVEKAADEIERMEAENKRLVEAVQKEHGGDITNPKCPICIAINAINEKPIDPNKWAFDRGLESY